MSESAGIIAAAGDTGKVADLCIGFALVLLIVAVAGLSVWWSITMRVKMSERRKIPGRAFWATVVGVGILLFYLLGYGPAAAYFEYSEGKLTDALVFIYDPMNLLNGYGPQPIQDVLEFYIGLWE